MVRDFTGPANRIRFFQKSSIWLENWSFWLKILNFDQKWCILTKNGHFEKKLKTIKDRANEKKEFSIEIEPFFISNFLKFLIENAHLYDTKYFWNILNWFQLNLSKMMQLNWLESQAEEIFSKKKSPKITNTRNGCWWGCYS